MIIKVMDRLIVLPCRQLIGKWLSAVGDGGGGGDGVSTALRMKAAANTPNIIQTIFISISITFG